MTQGNLIFFKGERNTGKSRLAMDTVKQFLASNPDKNRAVYVSMNQRTGNELIQQLPDELRSSAIAIGLHTKEAISDAEFVLAPRMALKAAVNASNENKNVLLVFDDVLLSQFKER